MPLVRSAAALIGICAACLVAAGHAMARSASLPRTSADAGYAVAGHRLSVVQVWVRLPQASRFAREMGSLAASEQLWTARKVIDLTVTACTDATCRPGGKPVTRYYRAVLAVYNRTTRGLICSTAAAGSLRCPNTPGAFRAARFAPGQVLNMTMVYTVPWTVLAVYAGDQDYQYPLVNNSPDTPTVAFTNARICVELGSTPWSPPRLRAPASTIQLMSFDRLPPPPDAAEIGNLNNHTGGIASPWWSHQMISTYPRSPYATAGPLWDDGYGLTVYLKP